MKTTIEIADALLDEARRAAAREGVTLRTLVERGLRETLGRHSDAKPFRLRKASFRGKGLKAAAQDADWPRIRDLAYEGRGG